MQGKQRLQVIVDESRVAPNIPGKAQEMKWHEDTVDADKGEPKMYFTQGVIHHAAAHLGKPEICAGENAEDGRNTHHHVEVTDDKISAVKIDVQRGLREEETADTAGNKYRDEAQGNKAGV